MDTSTDQSADSDLDPSYNTGGVPTSYNVTIKDASSPVIIADNGSLVHTHTFTGLVRNTLYTASVVAIKCAAAGSSNGRSEPTPTCEYNEPLHNWQRSSWESVHMHFVRWIFS